MPGAVVSEQAGALAHQQAAFSEELERRPGTALM